MCAKPSNSAKALAALRKEIRELPDGAKFYASRRAQDNYLASPECDHWTDADVERYGILAEAAYYLLASES